MKQIDPPPERYWTAASIETLAEMFELPNSPQMQDWPYEVANPDRVEEFTSVLLGPPISSDVQFTLLDMVFQSVEESDINLSSSEIGDKLSRHITRNIELHAYQVWYWAAFDIDVANAFRISPFCRELWNRISS
jgi:hypothetical protein